MIYPLIFWKGQDGYSFYLPRTDPRTGQNKEGRGKVTATEFYAYRIMDRVNHMNPLLHFREVFLQYVTDMYAKIESERLRFIRLNQPKLRVEQYIHLRDDVSRGGNLHDLGQLTILPSSFTGGPRYMHEKSIDALVYLRHFGRPTFL